MVSFFPRTIPLRAFFSGSLLKTGLETECRNIYIRFIVITLRRRRRTAPVATGVATHATDTWASTGTIRITITARASSITSARSCEKFRDVLMKAYIHLEIELGPEKEGNPNFSLSLLSLSISFIFLFRSSLASLSWFWHVRDETETLCTFCCLSNEISSWLSMLVKVLMCSMLDTFSL